MDHINHYEDCPELHQVDELIENYYLKGDYETCFRGCLELAEGGYPLAECQVGYFYLMGQGTAVDLDKALYWTKRAAEHGDPDAPNNLHPILQAMAGEQFIFSGCFDRLGEGALTLRLREKNPGNEVQLPFYYYDILVENVPVGKISIRIGYNFHTDYNGHIGYEVDPEFQGRGYARRACELVLEVARFHGMPSVLLTCAEDNIASYRTIERLGARLLCITDVPKEYFAWYEGIPKHRVYQLDL